jgi:hypothetical protein
MRRASRTELTFLSRRGASIMDLDGALYDDLPDFTPCRESTFWLSCAEEINAR